MTTKVTVSAKIDSKLRKELDKLGIKPSEVINQAIQNAIREKQKEILDKELEKACKIMAKVSPEEWTEMVRNNRDQR